MDMTRRVHGDELCEFHMGNYLENCERMIEFLKFELDEIIFLDLKIDFLIINIYINNHKLT